MIKYVSIPAFCAIDASKRVPTDKLIEFAKVVDELDIEYSYHLINFNPYESEEDMAETLVLLNQLPYSSLYIFKLVAFPGSPLYKMLEENPMESLPDNIQKWYGYIYTMIVKGAILRKLGLFIHQRRLFQSYLFFFSLVFTPSFVKLQTKKKLRKIFLGANTLMAIPVRKKKDV